MLPVCNQRQQQLSSSTALPNWWEISFLNCACTHCSTHTHTETETWRSKCYNDDWKCFFLRSNWIAPNDHEKNLCVIRSSLSFVSLQCVRAVKLVFWLLRLLLLLLLLMPQLVQCTDTLHFTCNNYSLRRVEGQIAMQSHNETERNEIKKNSHRISFECISSPCVAFFSLWRIFDWLPFTCIFLYNVCVCIARTYAQHIHTDTRQNTNRLCFIGHRHHTTSLPLATCNSRSNSISCTLHHVSPPDKVQNWPDTH